MNIPVTRAADVHTHLHANDSVDEEKHGDEQADVRQCLQTKNHEKYKSTRFNTHTHTHALRGEAACWILSTSYL